jgi:hypothetical protein
MEENRGYSQVIGNTTNAPYINQSLAQQGAVMTASTSVEHPSQPNYLDLFSGGNQGVSIATATNPQGADGRPSPTNYTPGVTIPFASANLGAELLAAGLSFTGYSESLPYAGFDGDTYTFNPLQSQYARKHNPWSNWVNNPVGNNQLPASVNQPFTSFPTDYSQLPTVSFVIPNLADDMHDGTDPTAMQNGDTWLKNNLNGYVQWASTHNSMLVVTWDENDGSAGNQIPTIFYGPMVQPGQYGDVINHYNVLRTVEDLYALPSHAGAAAAATTITSVWKSTTTTTLTNVNPSPANLGQAVTLTATVTVAAGAPAGSVTFFNGTTPLGNGTVGAGGVATLTTSSLPAGSDTLTAIYSGDGTNASSTSAGVTLQVNPNWHVRDQAVGADGGTRFLWQANDGSVLVWDVNSALQATGGPVYGPYPGWTAKSIAVGGNGRTWVLWENTGGQVLLWQMDAGGHYLGSSFYGPYGGWNAIDLTVGTDNQARILWSSTGGQMIVWTIDAGFHASSGPVYGPYNGVTVNSIDAGADGLLRVLWNGPGLVSLWLMNAADTYVNSQLFGAVAGWSAMDVTVGSDNKARILWYNAGTGQMVIVTVDNNFNATAGPSYGPIAGWTPLAIAAGADGKVRLLWNYTSGMITEWLLGLDDAYQTSALFGPY